MTSLPPRPEWSGIGADGWDGIPCPDDLYLTSASSVSKALAAPSLETWKIGQIVERLSERIPEFQSRATRDMDECKKWAGQLQWEPKPGATINAADSGTLLHSLLEAWLLGRQPAAEDVAQVQADPELTAMATNLWQWFQRFKPQPVAVEAVVYNPELGIAGRLDALVTFPDFPQFGTALVDLKNSRDARSKAGTLKRPFGDSHALQLAAYRSCRLQATFSPRIQVTKRATRNRTYLLNPREQAACTEATVIDSTFILQNDPERCLLYPVDTGPSVQRRLVDVLGAGRWMREESKGVVGDPVSPPITLPDFT